MNTDNKNKIDKLRHISGLYKEKENSVEYLLEKIDKILISIDSGVSNVDIDGLFRLKTLVSSIMEEIEGLHDEYNKIIKEVKNGNR